ncbi:ISL3 family transposase [Fusobacterium necrophorum]|uniref:ISL3 family transposase n=1 Tax=Fusobacterium necrophorum TaxID=859 RepID=UPI00254E0377|nr:ISL3 family transposase [Fusobacterium necrophorum]MDK4473423.1 ISL3 family transposase [Fusobacterium necrophorum]
MISLSHSDFIKVLFDLQDPNLYFLEDDIQRVQKKQIYSKVLHATLTKDTCACPHCHSQTTVKNGFKTSKVRYLPFQNYPIIIALKKQRFLCKECHHSFTLETPIVKKYASISQTLKLSVLNSLQENMSLSLIAKQHRISIPTVQRILKQGYLSYEISKKSLPKVLCFDEFKSTKDSDGAMSFLFMDGISHKILDIVENRKLPALEDYFSRFSYQARSQVKYIVMDMYSPYIQLAKRCFPKANIVLDTFHIVQLVNRAFNQTRIREMNQEKTKNPKLYRMLKRDWKLYLQDFLTLSESRKYCHSLKQLISPSEKVDYVMSKKENLRQDYYFYQDMLYAVKRKDFRLFESYLERWKKKLSSKMQTAWKTLRKYRKYIRNSLETSYTNGALEGMNNFIKSVKRVAFGFRRFSHFRQRILIIQGIAQINPNF